MDNGFVNKKTEDALNEAGNNAVDEEKNQNDEIFIVPVTDEIDLHNFRPAEVKDLLEEYFTACIEKDILTVRIIHGKGTGALRKKVESCLCSSRLVKRYVHPAPGDAGGWGATIVELVREIAP
jgi:dsDNA-specific endonuclease/ATPase MutS2